MMRLRVRLTALLVLVGAFLGLGMATAQAAHACDYQPGWHLDCTPQEGFLDCNWYYW